MPTYSHCVLLYTSSSQGCCYETQRVRVLTVASDVTCRKTAVTISKGQEDDDMKLRSSVDNLEIRKCHTTARDSDPLRCDRKKSSSCYVASLRHLRKKHPRTDFLSPCHATTYSITHARRRLIFDRLSSLEGYFRVKRSLLHNSRVEIRSHIKLFRTMLLTSLINLLQLLLAQL